MVPDHYLEVTQALVDWPLLHVLINDRDRVGPPHFLQALLVEQLYGERATAEQVEQAVDALG